MNGGIHLVVSTPVSVLVDTDGIAAIRAEDESGSFGIHPGHADLITVLSPSVVRWRDAAGNAEFCAVLGGVLTVEDGHRVSIACRRGAVGNDLAALESEVKRRLGAQADSDRQARAAQMRLHARAVRQLMRYLRPDSNGIAPPRAPAQTDDGR